MKSTTPRIRALAAAVALAFTATLVMAAGGSPAGASEYNLDFDAYCESTHQITAGSPDLTHYPGWQVVWAPTLYQYTSAGWRKYQAGPAQVDGGSWMTPDVTFSGMPRGYYQIRNTYTWLYNGQKTGAYAIEQPALTKLRGPGFYYGAGPVSTLTNSYIGSQGYCYMY